MSKRILGVLIELNLILNPKQQKFLNSYFEKQKILSFKPPVIIGIARSGK